LSGADRNDLETNIPGRRPGESSGGESPSGGGPSVEEPSGPGESGAAGGKGELVFRTVIFKDL